MWSRWDERLKEQSKGGKQEKTRDREKGESERKMTQLMGHKQKNRGLQRCTGLHKVYYILMIDVI